jgi:hypothetical protein
VDRPTSGSTDARAGWLPREPVRRAALVALALAPIQALLFYDHFAVALTLLFGFGLGFWLRTWKAAAPALASFLLAYVIAVGTGWLHDARPLWEPLLGAVLAALGGAIGGGIFDVLRRDVEARAPAAVPLDPY